MKIMAVVRGISISGIFIIVSAAAWSPSVENKSKVPPPSINKTSQSKQAKSADNADQSGAAHDVPNTVPLFAYHSQTLNIQEEAPKRTYAGEKGSPEEWWPLSPDWTLNILTLGLFIVGIIQIIVFSIQASALKATIAAMKKIAADQTTDMQSSIIQATNAATAMQSFAESAAKSAVAATQQAEHMVRQSGALDAQVLALQSQAQLLKASMATERPHIFVYGANEILRDDWQDEESYIVKFNVANFGRVPGIITHVKIGLIEPHDWPSEPPALDNSYPLKQDCIFSVGEIRKEVFYFPFQDFPLRGDFNSDGDGSNFDFYSPKMDARIRFMVTIYYEGPTTRGHRTIATWIFDKRACRFVKYEDPLDYEAYNCMD